MTQQQLKSDEKILGLYSVHCQPVLEQNCFKGGATRLFLDGNYTGNTVDVLLPQGYGLVFQQKGMLHAGLPVKGQEISEGNEFW